MNAYVKLKPTNPGSMEFRDMTEKRAVNKMIRLAHDSNLQKEYIIFDIYISVLKLLRSRDYISI